jgi:hypothetical protein
LDRNYYDNELDVMVITRYFCEAVSLHPTFCAWFLQYKEQPHRPSHLMTLTVPATVVKAGVREAVQQPALALPLLYASSAKCPAAGTFCSLSDRVTFT